MANEKRFLENRVTVLGMVKSIKITDRDEVGPNKFPAKSLRMVVTTGEGENHTVEAFAMKHFIDRQTNKVAVDEKGDKVISDAYDTLCKVENEYIPEELTKQGKKYEGETASVIRVNGSIKNNMYKGRNGQVIENLKIEGRFFHRVEDISKDDYGVKIDSLDAFTLTGATRVLDENENETEEVTFKAATIDYKGIAQPFEFTVQGKMADGVEDGLEQGMSVLISGSIRNKFHTYEVAREASGMSFGETIVDIKRETIRKNIATGINVYDEDDAKAISRENMTEAVKKYEAAKLEVKSSEPKKKEAKANNGFNAPAKKPVASTMTADLDADSLPF
ncbi:hypothetical protein [Mammaliicoccus sciuri]|uniref:hypothetical protein n=1 Tax=Mammaliicoccus sciuri TaxID=1296 RepID=UPI0021CF5229|nr:hypothetical protein [Mammaliicoccus sciuri]UXU70159.1 hypothetical protein MUA36_05620 [Mammaliicoccus sciuri]